MSSELNKYAVLGYLTPEDSDLLAPSNYWVRALDTVYVVDDYWTDNYTVVTHSAIVDTSSTVTLTAIIDTEPTATLDSTVTVTASALKLRRSTATVNTSAALTATCSVTRGGTATANTTALATVAGVKNTDASLSLTGVFAPTIIAIAKRVGETTLTINSTVSATPTRTQPGSVTMLHNGNDVAWQDMGPWYNPTQETWAPRVSVRAEIFAIAGTNLFVIATAQSSAKRITDIATTLNTTATVTASGTRTRTASAALNSTATADSAAIKLVAGAAQLAAEAAQLTQAVKTARGSATANSAAQTAALGGKLTDTTSTLNCTVSTAAQGTKLVRSSATNNITTSITQALGSLTSFGSAALDSTAELTAQGRRFRTATSTLTGAATIDTLGGLLLTGSSTLNSTAQLAAEGRFVRFDPYRKITVLAESRTLAVTSENKLARALPELRVGAVAIESRRIRVLAESRVYLIDRGTPTIVSTNPYQEERL